MMFLITNAHEQKPSPERAITDEFSNRSCQSITKCDVITVMTVELKKTPTTLLLHICLFLNRKTKFTYFFTVLIQG